MRLSASKARLAEHCLGWLSLPVDHSSSDAAEEGTRKHALLEDLARGVPLPSYEGDWAENAVDIVTRLGLPARYDAEVSFAWSPEGSRVLGMSLGRDYSGALLSELVGTVDILHRPDDGRPPVVADWKTGSSNYGDPSNWGQLAMLAVMVADAFGYEEIHVAYLYTETGEIVSRLLDSSTLAEHRATMEWLWDLVQEPQPQVPGAHCSEQYCPSIGHCPAVAAEFGQLVPAANLTAIRSHADAARWLDLKPRLQAAMKKLDSAVREMAESGPIDLGDGYEYRLVTGSRKGFDKDRAVELLGERAGECEKTTEFQQLRKRKVRR